jgi:transposase InsO family protein
VDGTRVVIIVLLDDHSRYCLRCHIVPDLTAETAIQAVQSAWQEFGVPTEIVSDNGRAFTGVYEDSFTPFGKALRAQGIHHRLITPYYPEGNGKAEAFVKILKRECLNRCFATIEELEHALAEFVVYYNHFRLHSSLGYTTPISRYLGDDGESESFGDLSPGDYDVAEAATSQWKLDAVVCVGGDSTTKGNGASPSRRG